MNEAIERLITPINVLLRLHRRLLIASLTCSLAFLTHDFNKIETSNNVVCFY